MSLFIHVPALLLFTGAAAAHNARGGLSQRSLRAVDEPVAHAKAPVADNGVVKPFSFDQKLLVCNAYPSDVPIECWRGAKNLLGKHSNPVGFRECRYVQGGVQAKDKLDLSLSGQELKSTFEVGALPNTDAILLLVPYRKPGSPLIRFQSFAFPQGGAREEAQLAVIDTFAGNTSAARLLMQDHLDETQAPQPKSADGKAVSFKAAPKRQEQLNFDRVYSVEAGLYDASVDDAKAVDDAFKSSNKVVNLAKDGSYVVIRTGDDRFGESLVVFPETPMPKKPKLVQSGARSLSSGLGWLVFAALAALRL
jgi:hypothetical protein